MSSGWINWWDASFPCILQEVWGPSPWKILKTKNTGEVIWGLFAIQLKSCDYLNLACFSLFVAVSGNKVTIFMLLNVFEHRSVYVRSKILNVYQCMYQGPGAVARSEVCPLGMQAAPSPAHSFVETWLWKNFYGHSPSSADSRRAVISYWRKNVH